MTEHNDSSRGEGGIRPDTDSEASTSKFVRECDNSISLCVIETVAEATETDPEDLQPLYEILDPDSLDELFESSGRLRGGCLTFRYEGCDITVDADGWIAVSPRANDGE